VQRELQNVFDAANRNNTAIYSVDPRGLATGEFDINENVGFRTSNESLTATQDTLRVLSDETDGRAIVNRNDLAKGMQQIMRDSSAYYLLGYNSSQAPQDGKFHAIKVRVKRPGTQIRARTGSWAPGTRRGAPRDVTLLVASPEGEVVFRGDVGGAAAATANGNGGAAGPLGTALGNAALGNAAPGNTVSFDAPPGKLELRMTVRGADKETLDTEDREIVVPDLTATDVRIGTPRLFVARNAREFQQLSQDPSATPTAGRDFRRTDRLIVRVDAFGPGEGTKITSRLLNRQGQRMVDVPVARGEGSLYVIDLPLSSLAPGEYLLEVAAAADGQQPVTELVAFKVGT
jgi:hypothetical protein